MCLMAILLAAAALQERIAVLEFEVTKGLDLDRI